MSLLKVPIPHPVKSSINAIAATATPITMIMLGAQIDLKQLGHDFKAALGACLLRLVLVPAILVFIMILAGFRGPELGALMVVFAAPSAITNLVMARSYNIAPEFTAETVYLSTILSMITMFIAISLLRGLGFF
jgi:predicted permease